MRSMLEKTLDLAFGAAALTREKAQEFVDDLVKRGEAAKDESGSLVDDILKRGQKQREEVQAMVQREVSLNLSRMNIATRDDMSRLERRIQELEVMLEDLRGRAATAPSETVVIETLPPEVPGASKSSTSDPTASGE